MIVCLQFILIEAPIMFLQLLPITQYFKNKIVICAPLVFYKYENLIFDSLNEYREPSFIFKHNVL